jgi:hypothetical protein
MTPSIALAQRDVTYSAATYSSDEEARSHPLPVPEDCLKPDGKNVCGETLILEKQRFRLGPWVRMDNYSNGLVIWPKPKPAPGEVHYYESYDEAKLHPLPMPSECLDNLGHNRCVETFLGYIFDGRPRWVATFWIPSYSAICYPAVPLQTSFDEVEHPKTPVDCAASGAVAHTPFYHTVGGMPPLNIPPK